MLTQHLTPAQLRVGGTQADYDVYQVGAFENFSCSDLPSPMNKYRCSAHSEQKLRGLFNFVRHNNLSLVYGLNDMYGRPTKTRPEEPICSDVACPPLNTSNIGRYPVTWSLLLV